MDPFGALGIATTPATSSKNAAGTLAETGSCTLYPYGFTLSATGAQSQAGGPLTPLKGCDLIPNPVQGQNCFPVVSPGSVQTVLTSTVFPGFQGYVIAVCNFQYAHGYAAVTDLGLRGLFSSYLAIELNYCQPWSISVSSGSSTATGTPGCPVGQVRGTSIEFNDH